MSTYSSPTSSALTFTVSTRPSGASPPTSASKRAEGRLRYLRTRVALSTLDVTVHERAPILAGSPAANPLLEALRQAWRNFVAVLAFGIASLGVLLPLAVVGVVGWRLWRRWKA